MKTRFTIAEFAELFDFCLSTKMEEDGTPYYALVDRAGGNLNNIENEHFYSVEDVVLGLQMYYHDFIYRDLVDEYGYTGEENYETIEQWLNEKIDFLLTSHQTELNGLKFQLRIVESILNPEFIDEVPFLGSNPCIPSAFLTFTTINVDGEKRNWEFNSVDDLRNAYDAEDFYDLPGEEDSISAAFLQGVKLNIHTFGELCMILFD